MGAQEGITEEGRLSEAFLRYEGRLVRCAIRVTGDRESARDVVQETFLRWWTVDRSRLNGHDLEWLVTACRRRALDVRKKEERMIPVSQTSRDTQGWVETRPSCDPAPSARLQTRETAARVLRMVRKLPQDRQRVFRLRVLHEMDYDRISELTNRPVSTVRWLHHMAIKTLREQLGVEPGTGTKAEGTRS